MSDIIKIPKFPCETCKLSYSSQSELLEHNWSLMHHVRLEQKEKPTEHTCCLCQISTNNLVKYGQHLNELTHKKALTKLREKKTSENTKPSLMSIRTSAPPFLMPNKSWHLNVPFSNFKPYISPLNGHNRTSQSYPTYPSEIIHGDRSQCPKGTLLPCSEERVSLSSNENTTEDGSGDKQESKVYKQLYKTISKNQIESFHEKNVTVKKRKRRKRLNIEGCPSGNGQSMTIEDWFSDSETTSQNESAKVSNQPLPESSPVSKSRKKMIVTTSSGFHQRLFLEDDFKKNNLDLARLNLINAKNDKGNKVFGNKLAVGFLKHSNNISQHSSLSHFQPTKPIPNQLNSKSNSLKTSSLPKKLSKPPESSTAVQPLNDPSKTQPQTFLKVFTQRVSKPLKSVKDSQNKPNTIDKNLTTQKKINSNDKTVKVQSENILPSPNTSNNTVESTENNKNLQINNSLSENPKISDPKSKSINSKESDPKTTKVLKTKSKSTSSSGLATYKSPSLSKTAVSGLAKKRALHSEHMAHPVKPNPVKKLKSSTIKEIKASEKNQNLSLDCAGNSSKKVDAASNSPIVSSSHEHSNHLEELNNVKPDSTVEKQQLGKNVGKEELVKMTRLSCLNHKEKMHLSSVMKSYSKTQNKRSAVPRLTMQLSNIYNPSNQEENSKNLNLPEGLEDQITMLIKKENLDEFENRETLSSSDQLITETGQAALHMNLQPATVSDAVSILTQPNLSSESKNSLASAGNKVKSKSSAVSSKTSAKSLSSNRTLCSPPLSSASVCTPITTVTAPTTNITTTTYTGVVSNYQPPPIVISPEITDQNAEDTVESNNQTPDVFSKVYLLTLQEEEVCSNISSLNPKISYLEKLIEDSQIALQATKDKQQSLMEEEKKIRKMRIGILKEAMGDTNRSNKELINQLLTSNLNSERALQNSPSPPLSSLLSNETQNDTVYQKIPSSSTTAALEKIRPAAVLDNSSIQTRTQQKQPTLAALLAKGIQPEPSNPQQLMNCITQGTQPQQLASFTQQKPQQSSSVIQNIHQPSSVTKLKLHQPHSVAQEEHHKPDTFLQNKNLELLLPKDTIKNLKIPKALISSVFENQKPLSNIQHLQVGIFSQQEGANTLHSPNVPKRISSGKEDPKCSVFQFNQETPLTSTKETVSNPSDLPTANGGSTKDMSATSQSLISIEKKDCSSCESEINNASVEQTTIPFTGSFSNVQIKTEPLSPEAVVSDSIFNFQSIKEEPKSPTTQLGNIPDSTSNIPYTDKPSNNINEGQSQLFLQKNFLKVTSSHSIPTSSESGCVNPSHPNNIENNGLLSEPNLQTTNSDKSSNLSINLPVAESQQMCIKEERLSPVTETSITHCIPQSGSLLSLQSSIADSNHSVKPTSLPTNNDNKKKPNDEELEFFSSLSVKSFLDSSHIESLPENLEPQNCSGQVSMKYLGSMSNNLVEQLKECWKKQNVTMNKCFPQGQTDNAGANIPNDLTALTCETSLMRSEKPSPLLHPTPPYTMNIEKSNKFVLPANLNPVVSIEPLNLSSKYNSPGSKSVETVDVKTAKNISKPTKAICNSEMSLKSFTTVNSLDELIIIDGDSSSEDIDTVNTKNKLLTSTNPQEIYINSNSKSFSTEFSTDSHKKDFDFLANTNAVYKGPNCPVTSCVVFRGYLYASYQGHSPQKFDLKTRICVKQYDCQPFSVQCMLVTGSSNDNPLVFSGGASETVLIFNEITGQLLTKIDLLRKIYTFHEKWNCVFVGLAEGGVTKINLKTLKETSNISYGTKPIHCLATCTEGALRILCVGAYDASILIVDASSGLPLKTLLPCQRLLYSIKVSQNLIYSCSEDRKLAVYDIESEKLLKCVQWHSGTVSCLYVDNKILVTGSHDKLINVYWGSVTELDKIQPLSFYGADKQSISCLTVSDRKIYSGNFYGTIEAVNLPNEISTKKWLCRYNKCTLVFGLCDDLRYHVHSEHLKRQIAKQNNWQCLWTFCSEAFNSLALLTTHCDKHFNQ